MSSQFEVRSKVIRVYHASFNLCWHTQDLVLLKKPSNPKTSQSNQCFSRLKKIAIIHTFQDLKRIMKIYWKYAQNDPEIAKFQL